MRVAIGSDHRGVDAKQKLIEILQRLGHDVSDVGPEDVHSVDYPDYAEVVAKRVATGQCDRGVLLCGTGIGMAIAANKIPGVRAATCYDDTTAEMSRRHNDANVLCLAADSLRNSFMDHLLRIWFSTEFEGGRHARRIEKISRLECSE